ncbi:LOW QUALITY PROTEIN: glycoprotein endo-alpha-1,2-mannosidase-like protein [Cariama cristata]
MPGGGTRRGLGRGGRRRCSPGRGQQGSPPPGAGPSGPWGGVSPPRPTRWGAFINEEKRFINKCIWERPALLRAAVGAQVLPCAPGLADDNGEPSDRPVAFHIQAYKGRDDHTVHENIRYIMDKYRSHAAFCKCKTSTGKSFLLFRIYSTPAESWANLLMPSGSHSLRNTAYYAVFTALLMEEGHKHEILSTGYDGMYTYLAFKGFSFSSSHQNLKSIKTVCDSNNLMFIPSIGPVIDTSIRPWNNHNTQNRVNGKYYETALQAAVTVRPEIISIASFNEWPKGTQIEKAAPKKMLAHRYLDYLPHQPSMYLELTRRWAEHFRKEEEQWLM